MNKAEAFFLECMGVPGNIIKNEIEFAEYVRDHQQEIIDEFNKLVAIGHAIVDELEKLHEELVALAQSVKAYVSGCEGPVAGLYGACLGLTASVAGVIGSIAAFFVPGVAETPAAIVACAGACVSALGLVTSIVGLGVATKAIIDCKSQALDDARRDTHIKELEVQHDKDSKDIQDLKQGIKDLKTRQQTITDELGDVNRRNNSLQSHGQKIRHLAESARR